MNKNTKKEIEELLIALCGYLPYGLKCSIYRVDDDGIGWRDAICRGYFQNEYGYEFYFDDVISIDNVEKVKPYLRPMLSMTDEEKKEYQLLQTICGSYHYEFGNIVDDVELLDNFISIDWLDKHCFDYRGLIKIGLALEAPEEMYDIKTE